MNSSRRFAATLAGFVLLYFIYGLHRLSLGVDFTDEGAYVAWPLRTLFGEPPFAGDPLLALRPMFNHLSAFYRIHPGISLYELRLLGWIVHLGSFVALSTFLYRLSGSSLHSLLLASVPFFVCHVFGLAAPSYNTTSSDFLLIALSLLGLAARPESQRPLALHIAAGLALFVATFAHPAIGFLAVLIGLNEIVRRNLLRNCLRLQPTASNTGFLTFAGCWLVYLLQFLVTGSLAVWLERSSLYRSARVKSLEGDIGPFFLELLSYPFSYDGFAIGFSAAVLVAASTLAVLAHRGRTALAESAAIALAMLLLIAIIGTFSFNVDHLPAAFAMASLVVISQQILRVGGIVGQGRPDLRFLFALSAVGALLYATLTYYFSPLRSWISGILALPFAFAVGLSLLLRAPAGRFGPLLHTLATAVLVLAIACVARDHYRFIYRDASPAQLTATFRAPKFRHIRSTPERAQAVDALYDYLHPKLVRGEPLLAFDDCPLVYFLLEVQPAYGLTWATRYTQNATSLARFDEELRSRPLPRYAIRTLVDLSNPIWAIAPTTTYADYPLNATVTSRYEIDHTIFPFEIWRLKTTPP